MLHSAQNVTYSPASLISAMWYQLISSGQIPDIERQETLACLGGAVGIVSQYALPGYGDRRVWVRGPGWPDHCVRL